MYSNGMSMDNNLSCTISDEHFTYKDYVSSICCQTCPLRNKRGIYRTTGADLTWQTIYTLWHGNFGDYKINTQPNCTNHTSFYYEHSFIRDGIGKKVCHKWIHKTFSHYRRLRNKTGKGNMALKNNWHRASVAVLKPQCQLAAMVLL